MQSITMPSINSHNPLERRCCPSATGAANKLGKRRLTRIFALTVVLIAGPAVEVFAGSSDTVTVTFINSSSGDPIEGQDVVFQNDQGSVVAFEQTDASGTTSSVLPNDSFVTIPRVNGSDFTLLTIGDVQPGDDIVLRENPESLADTVAQTLTIDWPGTASDADNYEVTDGCSVVSTVDPTTPSQLDVMSSCTNADTADIMAEAVNDGGTLPRAVAHSIVLDHAIGDDTLVMPPWDTDFQEIQGRVSNFEAGSTAVGDGKFLLDGNVFDFSDSTVGFTLPLDFVALIPQGITPDATELGGTGLILSSGGQQLRGFVQVTKNMSGLPTDSTEIDLTADGTRPATDGLFDISVPRRPGLDWAASGPVRANFTRIIVTWDSDSGDHSWSIVTAPEETGLVRFPAMPESLSEFVPNSASIFGPPQVTYFFGSWITEDWATLRQSGGVSQTAQPQTDFTLAISAPTFTEQAIEVLFADSFESD